MNEERRVISQKIDRLVPQRKRDSDRKGKEAGIPRASCTVVPVGARAEFERQCRNQRIGFGRRNNEI